MRIVLLLISVIWSANTLACGSVSQNMQMYWTMGTLESKETFLLEQSCYQHMNYSPLRADPIITSVVSDAINIGVKKAVINKAIDSFNCMYGAYHLDEYENVSRYILENGMEATCNTSRLDASYIVTTQGGVNLRSKPSTSGSKIGTVAEGVLVMVLRIEGSWAYVESYAGKGYIYLPLLQALKNA